MLLKTEDSPESRVGLKTEARVVFYVGVGVVDPSVPIARGKEGKDKDKMKPLLPTPPQRTRRHGLLDRFWSCVCSCSCSHAGAWVPRDK